MPDITITNRGYFLICHTIRITCKAFAQQKEKRYQKVLLRCSGVVVFW